MTTGADKVGRGDGPGGQEQPAGVSLAELRAAYRVAVAHRDEWLHAYVILRRYAPAPSGCGSDWHLELISDQAAP